MWLCVVALELSGAEEPAQIPRELQALKARYEADTIAALKPVKARYQQQLEGLMKSLTVRGDLSGAMAVKSELDVLKATQSAGSNAVVGYWRFQTGGTIEIKENGYAARPGNEKAGRWSWTNSASKELRIDWGTHKDDLTYDDQKDAFTGKSSTGVDLKVHRATRAEFR